MLQLKNKKKIYFYLFSFLFLSTIINNDLKKNFNQTFLIRNIIIQNNSDDIKDIISNKTKFLLTKNIFNINKQELTDNLKNLNFLENININIKYPSTIKIKANRTDFIATTYINQKKFYVGSNREFISSKKIYYKKDLPIIFGTFKIANFQLLKEKLSDNKIKKNEIIKYYFHKNGRWDLYFKNNIIIKLPKNNIEDALKIYNEFNKINKINFNTIVDLRISNRLVLKNE
tara:strand:+ start:255 stop:944 length:690 start_codon:yes stop_codon:yes gene_type:complete